MLPHGAAHGPHNPLQPQAGGVGAEEELLLREVEAQEVQVVRVAAEEVGKVLPLTWEVALHLEVPQRARRGVPEMGNLS